MQQFTRDEVAKHSTPESAWLIIDSEVFDITNFAPTHPGGEMLLLEYAGKEVTKEFYAYHRQSVLFKFKKLKIGNIVNEKQKIVQNVPGHISSVPYSEPSHLIGFHSPYYTESHIKYRKAVRSFLQTLVVDYNLQNPGAEPDQKKSFEVYKKLGGVGIIAATLGPGKHLEGFKQLGSVENSKFDYFHELIVHEEFSNAFFGADVYEKSYIGGMVIGTPPVMNFGSPALQSRILPPILTGEKRIVLAISEPFAGSDVAQIKCTAKKSADGKHYIVNGVKKWITGGPFADYFATAVRTGSGKGASAISMLLIERDQGVETKKISTSEGYNTAYVYFENVKVPVENLLGKEGMGFQVIMYNFNHERWIMIVACMAMSRLVLQECFKWANQREVFGKTLIHQPVIRNKLAHMVSEVESMHSWLESITYQMTKMSYKEQAKKLAGPIGLGKLKCTRVAHYISDEACQVSYMIND